mgnify:CR=1 FL=1
MKHLQGHILLVEDDDLTSELLEKYLHSHNLSVTVLPDGEQLVSTMQHQKVDAVILDIVLPGKSGLEWLEWLQIHYPQIPVLLCSRHVTAEDRVIGLSKGAVDYIVKPFHPKEVLLRLHNVLAKPTVTLPRVGIFQLDAQRAILIPYNGSSEHQNTNLTLHEVLLLQLFFAHVGDLVTRDQIAECLHGSGHDPTKRSLDMLINRLRKKLGDSGEASRYLHTVWGKGYRFTP